MRDLEKYKGVIPAFYACYDEKGEISPEGVRALTEYYIRKGARPSENLIFEHKISPFLSMYH